MNRLIIYRWGLALLALIALMRLPDTSHAQGNAPTFQTPLAFVGGDGNVYLIQPGSTQPTPLTQDADFKLSQNTPAAHFYTHLRWSPDGKTLAFQDSIARTLYIVPPGKPPQVVATNIATEYPAAWQPDNSAIVYIVNTQQQGTGGGVMMNIQQVAPDGSQSKPIGSFTETAGCGGSSLDAAGTLYALEAGGGGNGLTLAWTPNGWLYSTACTGIGVALLGPNNQPQWTLDTIGRVVVSPSGAHAVGVLFDQGQKPTALVNIDLAGGHFAAVSAVPSADQVGWSADENTIFYSTIDNQKVTLWQIPAQGTQATSIFSDQGSAIGAIAGSPDSQSALFSYIPATSSPQTQLLMVPLNGSPATLSNAVTIAQGGQPAFAIMGTSVVTPTNTPIPVVQTCTPRTDWQYTYTVIAGDTLFSIAQRAGTSVDVLAAGNCLVNANAINAGQVLRVPVPISALPVAPNGTRIQFPPGATSVTVQGQIAANGADQWVLKALAGQTLSAQLSTAQAILIVYGADGTVLQTDHAGASSFTGVLPFTEDYIIDVRNISNGTLGYALTITIPPLIAPPPNAKRIQFPPGAITVTVQGQVAANSIDRWVLKALAGQTLTAQLSTTQAILIVYGIDGTVLQTDHAGASSFTGVLPFTEDYIIDVRNVTNGTLGYALTITVPPLAAPPLTARRIQFPPGAITVTVQGQVTVNGADRWVLKALGGQTLTAQLSTTQAIVIVFGADGTVLQTDHVGASSFTGVLPSTQDYVIDVRSISTGIINYALTITVPPMAAVPLN